MNKFVTDAHEETELLISLCEKEGIKAILCEGWGKGSEGTAELATEVCAICDAGKSDFHLLYPDSMSLEEKIYTIAHEMYHAAEVTFSAEAKKRLSD